LKAGDRIEFLRSPNRKAVSVREMDKGIERAVRARWRLL